MSSKQVRLAIPAALILSAAGLWWERKAHAQTTENHSSWEFATVEALDEYWRGNLKVSAANICYHATNGCRWDTVRVSVDRWGQMHDGMAAATARLGDRGWEAVSVNSPNDYQRLTILLRRVRQAESGQ